MRKKISNLLMTIFLSGCGATVNNIGSVHDKNISGSSKHMLVVNNLSNDNLSKQGEFISEDLKNKLNSCNVLAYTYNTNGLSLNPNTDINNIISDYKIDRVISLTNRNITVNQSHVVLSQVIVAKVYDIALKKNIWMSEYQYNGSEWHFGGIWTRHDVKAAQMTTKSIIAGLENDGVIGKCQ